MGVYSDGSYGAPKGVVYSFPVTCKAGTWSIVQVRSVAMCVCLCVCVLGVVAGP